MKTIKRHANVVTCYGYVDDPLAIVLAFCPGGSLDEALYGKHPRFFGKRQLHDIMMWVAIGVAHLDAEGIVHRDLAARNVLLDEYNKAMVSDFGMSRIINDGEDNTTVVKSGPLKWMAPEQLREQQYSRKSDVWALAVVFFECVSREPPFNDKSDMQAAYVVMEGGSLEVPVSASKVVAEVMRACWKQDPNARPTANEVVRRLKCKRLKTTHHLPMLMSTHSINNLPPLLNHILLSWIIRASKSKRNPINVPIEHSLLRRKSSRHTLHMIISVFYADELIIASSTRQR